MHMYCKILTLVYEFTTVVFIKCVDKHFRDLTLESYRKNNNATYVYSNQKLFIITYYNLGTPYGCYNVEV